MVREMRLTFTGSFQCRLATNPAGPGDSPASPFDSQGQHLGGIPSANGWTFKFQETAFDRVIRLSNPVALRNALMHPWTDTVVTVVEVDRGHGLALDSDAVLNKVVSLGNAKFDEASATAQREKLLDFTFGIGSVLRADADPAPQLSGVDWESRWQLEYQTQKPLRFAQATPIDPVRRKVFEYRTGRSDVNYIIHYSGFFTGRSKVPDVNLVNVQLPGAMGVLRELGDARRYDWKLNLTFFRFDGETLVGQTWGQLNAKRR